ncbi:uncharacterized protein LOC127096195 [Lathyrus oleraceus]|uniref:uncharacterized protein LOC127096195 n=1 Tax=Pisum sativum TaxID=3888 RepID=UPI0021CFDAAF|nr:uncharacterized protein LOC127096195 [Pisum sativum]
MNLEQLPEHSSVRKQELLNNLNFISNLNFIFVGAFDNFLIHSNFNSFFQKKENYICTYVLISLFHFLFISQMFFIIEQTLSFPGSESRIFVFMFFTCTISLIMMHMISWQLCLIVLFIWLFCVFYFGVILRRFKFLKESVSDEQTQLPEHHSIKKQKFSTNLLLIIVQNAVALGSFVALEITNNIFFDKNFIQIFLMFVGFNLHYTLIIIYDVKTSNLKNEMFEITVSILIHNAISLSLAFYISYRLFFVIFVVVIVSNMILYFPYKWISKLWTWISKLWTRISKIIMNYWQTKKNEPAEDNVPSVSLPKTNQDVLRHRSFSGMSYIFNSVGLLRNQKPLTNGPVLDAGLLADPEKKNRLLKGNRIENGS